MSNCCIIVIVANHLIFIWQAMCLILYWICYKLSSFLSRCCHFPCVRAIATTRWWFSWVVLGTWSRVTIWSSQSQRCITFLRPVIGHGNSRQPFKQQIQDWKKYWLGSHPFPTLQPICLFSFDVALCSFLRTYETQSESSIRTDNAT